MLPLLNALKAAHGKVTPKEFEDYLYKQRKNLPEIPEAAPSGFVGKGAEMIGGLAKPVTEFAVGAGLTAETGGWGGIPAVAMDVIPTTTTEKTKEITAKSCGTAEKGKYWFDSKWKDGVSIIGKTAYHYRSSWEANYARYLQMLLEKGLIAKWEHEPEIFTFPKVKRGLKGYVPDFKVTFMDGRIERHEVKGFMDTKAKTKLKRFIENYPHLTLKVIDKKWFDEIKSRGIKIDGWES